MEVNLFTSFAEEDREQLESFRALAKNPKHKLKFHDHSQMEPVRDKHGDPVRQPPRLPTSKQIREYLHPRMDKSSRLVVLVGEHTHESEWIDWEIRTFYDKKKKLRGNTVKRLIAMRLRGQKKATLPKAVIDLSIKRINWNPDKFSEWLDTDINSL